MGYHTDFSGEILFENELTASQISALSLFFGEDIRQHPEWETHLDSGGDQWLSYVSWEFNDDFSGLRCDESEKPSGMVEFLNLFRNYMESIGKPIRYADGRMFAQGEEATDRWWITVKDNKATAVEVHVTGREIECPSCGHEFLIDLETEE